MKSRSFDTRRAILCYQYSERIKSELIIATKALEGLRGLRGDELLGAEGIVQLFLDALLGESEIAYGVTKLRSFREASLKITEAAGRLSLREQQKANRSLSEALSLITTCGGDMTKLLTEDGLL